MRGISATSISQGPYKLRDCLAVEPNKIPYIVTDNSRTNRFPHPEIDEGDTIKYYLEKRKISTWEKK